MKYSESFFAVYTHTVYVFTGELGKFERGYIEECSCYSSGDKENIPVFFSKQSMHKHTLIYIKNKSYAHYTPSLSANNNPVHKGLFINS